MTRQAVPHYLHRALPWALGALACGATLVLVIRLVELSIAYRPHMSDLLVYRTAGRQVLRDKLIYSRMPPHIWPKLGRSYLVFTYPPVAAILAIPLALFSWHVDRLAWVPLVYVPLAIIVCFAFRPLLQRAGRYAIATAGGLVIVCLFLLPVLQEIRFGQVDVALAALCVADIGTAKPRWPRGLLIGLATAIKLTPGVFIVYLLVSRRWRAALTAAATTAALTVLAWALVPRSSAFYWTSALFSPSRLGHPAQIADQSVRAMLLRAFPAGHFPPWLWIAIVLTTAAAALAAARQCALRGNEMAGVALAGLSSVLISPVGWIHHMVWVVVAIGALIGDGRAAWRWLAAESTAWFFIRYNPYRTTRPWPWLTRLDPSVVKLLLPDVYGIAAAGLAVLLAVLPRVAARAEPARPPPGTPAEPAPVQTPRYSTASDA